jgi:DNA-binding response OmpR family regulator
MKQTVLWLKAQERDFVEVSALESDFELVPVRSPAEAFAIARKAPLCALLVDAEFDAMKGVDAVRALRSAGVTTPLVWLCREATTLSEAELLSVRPEGFFSAPLDLSALKLTLTRLAVERE